MKTKMPFNIQNRIHRVPGGQKIPQKSIFCKSVVEETNNTSSTTETTHPPTKNIILSTKLSKEGPIMHHTDTAIIEWKD
jgi:hypothetical protein